jgi:hypothetical protein
LRYINLCPDTGSQPKEVEDKDMIKIHRWSSLTLALALLATVAFLIPGVLRASETDKDSGFAEKVAGTYLVTRDPVDGPSRILTIHSDGNLSSIQSIQFSEGASPEGNAGFSDQQGAWEKAGNQQIQATVLDFEYDLSDGTFEFTAQRVSP